MASGAFGDMGSLLKQAQKMQREMTRVKEEMKERVVEGSAGGGAIKAQVNGAGELLSVKISKEVIDPNDVSMLEDLIVAAVSAGLKKAQELNDEAMKKVTGGLNLPGMF